MNKVRSIEIAPIGIESQVLMRERWFTLSIAVGLDYNGARGNVQYCIHLEPILNDRVRERIVTDSRK